MISSPSCVYSVLFHLNLAFHVLSIDITYQLSFLNFSQIYEILPGSINLSKLPLYPIYANLGLQRDSTNKT